MIQELAQFVYDDHQVRVVEHEGMPWFVATDLAQVLEYRNASDLTRGIEDEDLRTHIVRTSAGPREALVVSEGGLYTILVRARTERARPFRRWVTHEVLPQIRKTGAYSMNQAPARELEGAELVARALVEATSMLEAKDKELAAASAQIESERPMVAKAIAHSANGKKLVTRSEFAREIISYCADLEPAVPVTFQEAFAFLSEIKLFTKAGTGRSDSGHATTWAIREQYARTEKGITSTGYPFATGKLTRAGQDFAWRRLIQRIAKLGSLALSHGNRAA